MILLEEISPYKNSYAFTLFENSDRIDLNDKIADIRVHLLEAVDERLRSELLVLIYFFIACEISDEQLHRLIADEIIFPESFGAYEIKIVRNNHDTNFRY